MLLNTNSQVEVPRLEPKLKVEGVVRYWLVPLNVTAIAPPPEGLSPAPPITGLFV